MVCTIGYVNVLHDQLHCIGNRVGRIAEIITNSNVIKTLRALNFGKILHVATKVKFLDGFVYPSTWFVYKNIKHGK
jgi:hypothetical protein